MHRALVIVTLAACAAHAPAPAPAAPVPAVAELAARRAQMIQWLREYTEAGAYPTDASGMPLSVFRDANGVRCPMAELIYRSGRADLVDAVVATDNAVRLASVHDGPLHDWMLSSGLSPAEIAMVQGIAVVDMRPPLESQRQMITASARERVRGRLETALVALRDNTTHGLEVAKAQLPPGRPVAALAKSAIHGPVVPSRTARNP